MYKQIKNPQRAEIVINKSTFISTSFVCTSMEEGKEQVEKIRKEFMDATHNCWAFICDKEQVSVKFSDDGEPQGTAGKPILEVLKNQKLSYTGVVVTRYFGGIKLGAGGLVRAYTKSAVEVLEKSQVCVYEMGVKNEISISYSQYEIVERYLKMENIEIISVDFQDNVYMTILNKENQAQFYIDKINDMTNGTVKAKEIGKDYYPF